MRKTFLLTGILFATSVAFAQDNIDSLLIGGQPSLEMLTSLASDGYEAVLSTRADGEIDWDEAALVDSLGMTFFSIPMEKPVTEITDEQVEQFDAFMREQKRSYLHCGSGNRVAALWAVWLIEHQNMGIEEAYARAEANGMRPETRDVIAARLSAERVEQ